MDDISMLWELCNSKIYSLLDSSYRYNIISIIYLNINCSDMLFYYLFCSHVNSLEGKIGHTKKVVAKMINSTYVFNCCTTRKLRWPFIFVIFFIGLTVELSREGPFLSDLLLLFCLTSNAMISAGHLLLSPCSLCSYLLLSVQHLARLKSPWKQKY